MNVHGRGKEGVLDEKGKGLDTIHSHMFCSNFYNHLFSLKRP